MAPERTPLSERYIVDPDSNCWIWKGATNQWGYGRLRLQENGERTEWLAHRWAYETLVGPIPDGLVLDHLCRQKLCVNPAHLEPVTDRVNIRRGSNSTLTFDQALRIRTELDRICEQYQISPATLRLIAERRTWQETAHN